MKLSLVFELLMIFVLLAFAASKSVKHHKNHKKGIQNKAESSEVDKIEDNSINKYCKCVEKYCNCCRDFALPLVNLNGPGCASLTYLNGDKMAVSLSFGKKVITNRTLSSKKPSPVCMPLPGGLSKFCGRVYNIARTGEDFRACLGLELQSKSIVEAAVRVSCFKFGAKGVTSEPADPLPLIPDEKGGNDDDDDDDDDDYGLAGDDDDDDDEADDDDEEGELEAVNDVGGSDYTGFSLLEDDLGLGDLFGSSGGKKSNKNKNKNKKKQAPAPSTTTTKRPRRTRRPSSRRPNTRTTTVRPSRTTTVKITSVNRRPTRRPARRPTRPNRYSTTASVIEVTPASIPTTSPSTTTSTTTTTTTTTAAPAAPAIPVIAPVTAKIQTFDNDQVNAASDDTFDQIIAIRPQSTTARSVTDFEHTGLEMSMAHITGQLSSMPVIPLNNEPKDTGAATKPEQVTYQKVEMITPKAPTTLPMEISSPEMSSPEVSSPEETVNDDMIQIVQSLDSNEDSIIPPKDEIVSDESRAYFYSHPISSQILNGAFKDVPKKKQRGDDLDLPDLDVIGLSEIGETIGDELGIFGGKKRPIKNNQDTEIKGDNDENSDYDDVLGTVEDALLLSRKSHKKNNKKRGRQNKMMRGDWALV